MTASRGLGLIAIALFGDDGSEPGAQALFRCAENSSEAIAGNTTASVHTAPAFSPTAQEAADKKTA
jgi:hypothetical protein